jgi:hypothetical protein
VNKELKTNIHDMAASIFTFIHENYLMRASTHDIKLALKKASELITILRKEDKEEESKEEAIRKIQEIEPIKYPFPTNKPIAGEINPNSNPFATPTSTNDPIFSSTIPLSIPHNSKDPEEPMFFPTNGSWQNGAVKPTPESQIASQPVKTRKQRSDAGKVRGSKKLAESKTI